MKSLTKKNQDIFLVDYNKYQYWPKAFMNLKDTSRQSIWILPLMGSSSMIEKIMLGGSSSVLEKLLRKQDWKERGLLEICCGNGRNNRKLEVGV